MKNTTAMTTTTDTALTASIRKTVADHDIAIIHAMCDKDIILEDIVIVEAKLAKLKNALGLQESKIDWLEEEEETLREDLVDADDELGECMAQVEHYKRMVESGHVGSDYA